MKKLTISQTGSVRLLLHCHMYSGHFVGCRGRVSSAKRKLRALSIRLVGGVLEFKSGIKPGAPR